MKTGVGDRNYNNVTDTTPIANGDSVTTAIGKLNNSIKGVTQDVINNSISGGHVDETGKVVLEKGEGENKSEVTTDIQLTDSEVSGVTLEKILKQERMYLQLLVQINMIRIKHHL